jgi:signal transduction histidine kinase
MEVLDSGEGRIIKDVQNLPDWGLYIGNHAVRSWIGVPLSSSEKVVGLFALDSPQPDYFTEDQLHLAEAMVCQAAIAIQNAWLFEQVRAGHDRLQSLSHRLVEVQETEREYIARELHDEAGQALTSLILRLDQLQRNAANPEAVQHGVEELEILVGEVIDNLHHLARDLRPATLNHLGLVAALRQYVEMIEGKHGLEAQFGAVGISSRFPPEMEISLYRIGQEALNNVVRHSQATKVDALLEQVDNRIILIVEDNGIGFDPVEAKKKSRLGILGMYERAEMMGGDLAIESSPGSGTIVRLELPYGNENINHR